MPSVRGLRILVLLKFVHDIVEYKCDYIISVMG